MSSKPKTKPTKIDSNEPNIDFNNIPTIQGTYRATKVNITAENSTKETSESIIDSKGLATTRRAPLHTTTSQTVLNHVESSPTDEPSTFSTKSTIATFNRNKSNEKQENEMKTTASETTTVRSDLDIFKDFRPDFENDSPWKPIVPGYVNTEFKLLPNDNVGETNYTESTTRRDIPATNDSRDKVRMPNAGISMTSSTVPPLGSVNFRDVSEINTFDMDNTDFPRDRVVPALAARPNDNGKLDIEVAGQLPSEIYSIKLKASSHNDDDRVSSSESSTTREVSENIPMKENAFQEKRRNSSATRKPEIKFDNSASMVPDDLFGSRSDEKILNDSLTSGIGVAEPVPDTEVELEAKNRYRGSSILALTTDENALRNRKVNPQQPIYTSYNTPDLNGGSLGSGLIENLATTKPFRHTIPVDKITSVVNYSINVPLHNSDTLSFSDDTTTDVKLSQDKVLTPVPSERVEVETSVTGHDDAMAQVPSYGQIISTDPNIKDGEIVKDDDRLSHFNITESYSEPKLTAKDSSSKRGVSRNSTFVEIDIVKHTPGESEENWEDEVIAGDGELQKKKVYNETLKAYVVENLVTLAPVKSHTGIGRPVRPRPKIDSPDVSLLEQLFGVRNYTHDRDTNTESAISESSSLQKIENPTKSDEKESSNHKSTIVEQIVEVVTSISTRVSSNIKSDPVILKFIISNSTTDPVTHSEETSTSGEANKTFESAVDTTEKILSWTEKQPFLSAANLRTMQTSDRKMSLEENRVLLEKLKQLAQVKTDDDSVEKKITRNNSNSSETLRPQDLAPPLNIDELKKIADVVTGNETLQNASSGFTLSRDGVKIFTKVLSKEEDRANPETQTMSMIRKISKTNGNCASATLSSVCRLVLEEKH